MKILVTLLFLIFGYIGITQVPDVEWQMSYGGLGNDSLHAIVACPDGGFIVGGTSASGISGNKTTPSFGLNDYWVLKFNADGEEQWQKSFGGDLDDYLYTICPATDGGYLIGGSSNSYVSGNKTADLVWKSDYWIIKIDDSGEIIWQEVFGANDHDILKDIQPFGNSGYILGGLSRSDSSGVKSENSIGYSDYWILRIDLEGNLVWENTIGGSNEDDFTSLLVTADSTIVIGGYSNSGISGDIDESCSLLYDDIWIVALNADGEIVWQNVIKGESYDYVYDLYELTNKNINVIAHSRSEIGDDKTSGNIGYHDYWIVTIDSIGEVLADTVYGSTSMDKIRTGLYVDENLFVYGGFSESNAGFDKTYDSFGNYDYWIIGVDTNRQKVWDYTFGGDLDDYFETMVLLNDGGIILGGFTKSGVNGNKTVLSNGLNDYWVIKLNACTDSIFYYMDADADGFGDLDVPMLSLFCEIPDGYVVNNLDCDDSDFTIFPGSVEVCNDKDDDCNGLIDDIPVLTYFLDADGDGFGNPLISTEYCGPIEGYVLNSWDCDDSDSTLNELNLFFGDNDVDGVGNSASGQLLCATDAPFGYSELNYDCDDNNILISEPVLYYEDADGDGYGNYAIFEYLCEIEPEGYVQNGNDCDDTNAEINFDAIELENLIDDNCNGLIDEGITQVENSLITDFQLFPNPANDLLTLVCVASSPKQITIKNIVGSIVWEKYLKDSKIEVDVSNFSSGIYFIELQTQGSILTGSFLKN